MYLPATEHLRWEIARDNAIKHLALTRRTTSLTKKERASWIAQDAEHIKEALVVAEALIIAAAHRQPEGDS